MQRTDIELRENIDEAIPIFIASAQWLIEKQMKLWDVTLFEKDRLVKENPESLFYVCYYKNTAFGALIVKFTDPFFWPDTSGTDALYLHKLCVKRDYAGTGLVEPTLQNLIALYKPSGIRYLRLDCDATRPKLIGVYEKLGFHRVETKQIGNYSVALFERKI